PCDRADRPQELDQRVDDRLEEREARADRGQREPRGDAEGIADAKMREARQHILAKVGVEEVQPRMKDTRRRGQQRAVVDRDAGDLPESDDDGERDDDLQHARQAPTGHTGPWRRCKHDLRGVAHAVRAAVPAAGGDWLASIRAISACFAFAACAVARQAATSASWAISASIIWR